MFWHGEHLVWLAAVQWAIVDEAGNIWPVALALLRL